MLKKNTSYRESLLHRITSRIRRSLELTEILNTAVQEIQAFLKVDRVKVYRFALDGSGEVIAEALHKDRLPALLNLRFPAEDIPPQAREMFIKARQRVIVDVAAQRKIVNLLDSPTTGESLSASDVRYSSVDPCHAQYLLTMGVLSSLIVPILHQGQLWGLLAIHNSQPRQFIEKELQVVQLLVDQVSIAIAQSNLLTQARQQAQHEAVINQVSSLLHCPLSLTEVRQAVLEATLTALHGSGGRLYIMAEPTGEPAQLYLAGKQPTPSFIEEMPLWHQLTGWNPSEQQPDLVHYSNPWKALTETQIDAVMSSLAPLNSSDSPQPGANTLPCIYTLAELSQDPLFHPLAEAFEGTSIRSVTIVPLRFHNQCVGWLSIFRDGHDTEILWAGRHDHDTRNRMPRRSFDIWREVKCDQAPTWSKDEIKLAQAIALHLYMAIAQKRVEAMVRYQASHDSLTQLPNRLLFDEQLSLALVQSQQRDEMLGVAFLDLDRFKTVNDTLGHAVGDQLLQQVAERLRECLRECDTIARWGGDEFTLLLPHLTSAEDITRISGRILNRLTQPFCLEGQEIYVTASLGIALAPYDGEDAETLLKNADAAMYRAKQQGKNNYQLFVEEMNQKALEQLVLEGDLRRALSRDEFLLYYQPQIDIRTGEIVGLEALLRWQHPTLGFISPARFIPIAEETGLICAIGDWVLQAACLQHQTWKAAGLPPIRIAVNLSARQFQQVGLVNQIMQTLLSTKVQPEYLEVEITESAAMQNIEFTIGMLRQLHQNGVRITMDDFGTGYSSLNAIKHFPLHTLKIDQSFVRDIVENPSDAAIAQTVVALGRGLKLEVLAEGVETLAQLEFLHSIRCDVAQGYFFSKPLPAPEMTNLLSVSLSAPSPCIDSQPPSFYYPGYGCKHSNYCFRSQIKVL